MEYVRVSDDIKFILNELVLKGKQSHKNIKLLKHELDVIQEQIKKVQILAKKTIQKQNTNHKTYVKEGITAYGKINININCTNGDNCNNSNDNSNDKSNKEVNNSINGYMHSVNSNDRFRIS